MKELTMPELVAAVDRVTRRGDGAGVGITALDLHETSPRFRKNLTFLELVGSTSANAPYAALLTAFAFGVAVAADAYQARSSADTGPAAIFADAA